MFAIFVNSISNSMKVLNKVMANAIPNVIEYYTQIEYGCQKIMLLVIVKDKAVTCDSVRKAIAMKFMKGNCYFCHFKDVHKRGSLIKIRIAHYSDAWKYYYELL